MKLLFTFFVMYFVCINNNLVVSNSIRDKSCQTARYWKQVEKSLGRMFPQNPPQLKKCIKPSLSSGVKIQSEKNSYNHGEKVEFECPNLKDYIAEGFNTATCDDGSFKPTITFKCHKKPKDCNEIKLKGFTEDGIYNITTSDGEQINVYCELKGTNNWTVFQKRYDGSVDFTGTFKNYEDGFGVLDGEFWLGLKKIRSLTKSGNWDLRVEIESFNGDSAYAEYNDFSISAAPDYTLQFGAFSGGTAGDALGYHRGMKFSTPDNDQDCHHSGLNCAEVYKGAWWYNGCFHSQLNAFRYANVDGLKSINWYDWKKSSLALKSTMMKIRRK